MCSRESQKPLDPSKPVRTKDGRAARIIATDALSKHSPIVALVMDWNGTHEYVLTYNEFGQENPHHPCGADLVNVPERIEGFVNFFRDRDKVWAEFHRNSAAADQYATVAAPGLSGRTATAFARLRVNLEEGTGLP